MGRRRKDLTGQRFGELEVLGFSHYDDRGRSYWIVRCYCGKCDNTELGTSRIDNLKSGNATACGKKRIKHGLGNTKIYRMYSNMYHRCLNPNMTSYENYGGRGITICDRWLDEEDGLLNFVEDMGECPDGLTLDRRDNEGDYTPDNCRFVDWKTQANNRRKVGE